MCQNRARIHLHAGMTCQLSYYTVQLQAWHLLCAISADIKSGWWKPIKCDKFVIVLITQEISALCDLVEWPFILRGCWNPIRFEFHPTPIPLKKILVPKKHL